MGKIDKENALQVQMFGSFSLSYRGRVITSKAKSNENQFNYLMQLLLHHRKEGVRKEVLVNALFYGRELNNYNHAIHSVIYNAKRRFADFGLPNENYIIQKDGVYYWTEWIPVWEDAEQFENLIESASLTADENQKTNNLIEAIHLYTGDFLENQVGVNWITRENWRYRKLFGETVGDLADLLRKRGDYSMMEDVGKLAARVQPYSDWETLIMESYVSRGMMNQAYRLFDDTVDLYQQQLGVRPSGRMYEFVNMLGTQMSHPLTTLTKIQSQLKEGEEARGGYECSYPVFMGVYQALTRVIERSGQAVYMMLCTIVDTKGNPLSEGKNLDELSERLRDAIKTTIRRSDIVTRYGKGQYLVLLINTTIENCGIVQKRIDSKFMINRQRISVKYHVEAVM